MECLGYPLGNDVSAELAFYFESQRFKINALEVLVCSLDTDRQKKTEKSDITRRVSGKEEVIMKLSLWNKPEAERKTTKSLTT